MNKQQHQLSVAICTYNGGQYIRNQMQSILDQTFPVDEIVVCDDGSTDDTLAIIDSLRGSTTADIHIFRNETNLGVCANFQKAVGLCHGDIIFLSDQDDIWCANKVETIVNYFDEHNDIDILFTDGLLIDAEGKTIEGETLWNRIGFTQHAQEEMNDGMGVELLAFENRATGATMAIRNSFSQCLRTDLCNDAILHDGSLAMLGVNSLGYITSPLIKYRIHPKQIVGIGINRPTVPSDDARETSPLCEIWNSLDLPSPLKEHIAFICARHRMKKQTMGLPRLLLSAGRYLKYYHHRWIEFLLFDIHRWAKTCRLYQ